MAQKNERGIDLHRLHTDENQVVGHSHIQTNTEGGELTQMPGGYIESGSELDINIESEPVQKSRVEPKISSDSILPIMSDVIIDNAPSKMLLQECKIVGMMEEFCSVDDEGMILDCEFNKKILTIKREASQKGLMKTKIKRNAVTNRPQIPIPVPTVSTSPVVFGNENIEFEWQSANAVDTAFIPGQDITADTTFKPPKNVRDRRATALQKRDEIKRQASEHGFWYTARYIHFERFKSKLNNIKSFSFWGSEMKHVESIFGTSVVSYFIFLRFIFLINLVLFFVITLFVIMPQLLFNYGLQQLNVTLSVRSNFTFEKDILGLVTGDSWFEDTELFYGSYTSEIIAVFNRDDPENAILQYRMPYAYLFTVLVFFLIFLIALIYKLGVAFRESYGTLGGQTSGEICNHVFGAWDYGITNESAARLRHHSITTDLKEEIDEQNAKKIRRTWKNWLVVIFLRIFFNIITFLLLAISGVIIVFSTLWALANRCPDSIQEVYLQPLGINIPGIINSFTIVILNFVLQFIFPFFARYERFRLQSNELKMTLVRSVLIRLASLIVLTLTLFVSYLFIQAGIGDTSTNETKFNPQEIARFINIPLGTNLSIESFQCDTFTCWETYFGQEFYRLAITNFVFAIFTTLFPEISRFILHRIGPKVWTRASKCIEKKHIKKYLNLLAELITSPPEFYIAKSVLDLIYAQALVLLGVFFCPFLPLISTVTFFVLFYVKKYSCVWFCSPSSRGLYRSARNNLFYILLLILIYFSCLAAIIYILINLNPSNVCGPFRDFNTFVGPIAVHLTSEAATTIVDLFKSPGVTYSLITLLLLLAYAQYIIVGSYKKNVKSLRHRLGVESADKQYYCDQLVVIFNQAESLRQLHNDILQMHYDSEMEYEFQFRERLSSIATNLGSATAGARLSWMGTNEREKLADRRKQSSDIDDIYQRTGKKQK